MRPVDVAKDLSIYENGSNKGGKQKKVRKGVSHANHKIYSI